MDEQWKKDIRKRNKRLQRKQVGPSDITMHKNRERVRAWSENKPERHNANNKKSREAHPEYMSDYQLKRLYGITLAEKREMWLQQNKQCAICCDDIPTLREAHVDHSHEMGEVRAILCSKCNHGLHYVENEIWLHKAKRYLRSHAIPLSDAALTIEE